jgi:LysR family transcriptional regulator, benzoate and cis,cis-muconate-responsive activator of ben and cat genes
MEIRHLRYFVAVAEELNFSRAAKRLNIAQPPLSQQIRHLEAELGLLLLARDTRPLRLTEAGRFFKTQALDILARVEEATAGARRIGRGQSGWFGVGYIGSAMNALLPPALHRFHTAYPGVDVQLFEMSYEEQIEALADRRIHLGFSRAPLSIDWLVEERLYEEPIIVAVPADHPLADRLEVAMAELAAEPIVHYARRASHSVDSDTILSVFHGAGIEPKIAVEAKNVESALGLVSAGLGIALMVSSFTQGQRPGVRFLALGRESPYVPMKAIYRSHEESQVLEAFLKIVREEVATLVGVARAA